MNQNQAILNHLQDHGSITPLEALEEYGCFRLAARIMELRHRGHRIATQQLKTHTKKTVARYVWEGEG